MRQLSDSAPPLTPDGATAQTWARLELHDSAYATAHPTAFDRFARTVQEFFLHLFDSGAPGSAGRWLAVAACIVVVAALVVAIVLWGRPGRRNRAASTNGAVLFGDVENRSADQLRRAARAAVDRADWDAAVTLRLRALARGLAERGLVHTTPGSTVHAFARTAADTFPQWRGELDDAATAFDAVRYLRLPGTPELYAPVADVDDALSAATSSGNTSSTATSSTATSSTESAR